MYLHESMLMPAQQRWHRSQTDNGIAINNEEFWNKAAEKLASTVQCGQWSAQTDSSSYPLVNSVFLMALATSNFSHVTHDVCFMCLRECLDPLYVPIDSPSALCSELPSKPSHLSLIPTTQPYTTYFLITIKSCRLSKFQWMISEKRFLIIATHQMYHKSSVTFSLRTSLIFIQRLRTSCGDTKLNKKRFGSSQGTRITSNELSCDSVKTFSTF